MESAMEWELRPASSTSVLRWRGLGQFEDLAIDFDHPDRVAVAVQLLQACLSQPSDIPTNDTMWRLTLSGRIGALIAVYALTAQQSHLVLVPHCRHDGCGEAFETALPLAQLLRMANEAEQTPLCGFELSDRHVQVRRPTGLDQKHWLAGNFTNESDAVAAMIAALVDGAPALESAYWPRLMEALDEHDPLVSFRLQCQCPSCGRENLHAVDLEAVLLHELYKAQRALLRDVHALASRYGWTEQQILTIPPARRRAYMAMIESV